jgi:hypothetical protein
MNQIATRAIQGSKNSDVVQMYNCTEQVSITECINWMVQQQFGALNIFWFLTGQKWSVNFKYEFDHLELHPTF